MKKIALSLCAIFALGLASCDEKPGLGIAQVNEQGTVIAADGVSVASTAAASLNLETLAGTDIPVLSYTTDASVPEDAEIYFVMQVSGSEDFANYREIECITLADNKVSVPANDWDDAFRALLGKAPMAKDNWVRFAGYMKSNGSVARLGGADTYFAAKQIEVTPVDLHINVEEAYYLVGTINDWNLATAVKFSHSDKNQYDDPVFSLAINVPLADDGTVGEYWWKIVPESAFQAQDWDGLWGTAVDGDSSLSGVLQEGGKAGCLKVAGQYLFTIDMLAGTYEVSQAIPRLYTPGNGNGWNFASGWLNTNNFADYFGFAHLNGDFKITNGGADAPENPNWGGLEWSAGEAEGSIALGASGNIPGPADGLYWVTVNLPSLTYATLEIKSIGIIGSFGDDNNWASDVITLTSDDKLVWTGDVTFPGEDCQWKFRTNGAWDNNPNLGGSLDNLETNGDNLSAPGAGTYTVTLDLRTLPYKASLTKK